MTRLGDLLEAMFLARRRFTTFSGTFRLWLHEPLTRQAIQATTRRGAAHSVAGPGARPEIVETEVRVWIGGPGLYREEILSDPYRAGTVTVANGDRWCVDDPARGVLVHEGGDSHSVGTHEVNAHLDPFRVMPLLDVESIDEAERAGRAGWLVMGRPRAVGEQAPPAGLLLLMGCDEIRMWVDRDTGLALHVDHRRRGTTFQERELLDFELDPRLPPDLFAIVAPAGRPVHRTADEAPMREITFEEAAQAAPFTVLVPDELPAGIDELELRFQPPVEFYGAPAMVMILGRSVGGRATLQIVEMAEGEEHDDGAAWDTVTREGAAYAVADGPAERAVRVVRHGTSVRLSGALDVDELIRCAASLRPVGPG